VEKILDMKEQELEETDDEEEEGGDTQEEMAVMDDHFQPGRVQRGGSGK